jgi:hypothetical protein
MIKVETFSFSILTQLFLLEYMYHSSIKLFVKYLIYSIESYKNVDNNFSVHDTFLE